MNLFKRRYMMRNIYLDDAMERGAELNLRRNVIGLYKNKVAISTIATSVERTQAEIKEILRNELGPDACQE
ncbi:MAG: hypothetical protein J6X67_05655 [Treponema sp.]|nr:hypothetical protein [Treponema sp.]